MGKAKKLQRLIVDQDIFGHVIGVHYRGRDAYKTLLGALCTLATYVLVTINLVSLVGAFIDGSNQQEKTQVTTLDPF